MINDLDESLRDLLIKKGGLDPSDVDISFDVPTRDWSTPVTRPTVNLYMYDLRENLALRETTWDQELNDSGRVIFKRRPRRIDVSYMVTCWTSAIEDQHRLLWHVLEIFFRNTPLPNDLLTGNLKKVTRPIEMMVAQSDGILKNPQDFWGALENQLRPAISVTATLELDLAEVTSSPMTFSKILRFGQANTYFSKDNVKQRLQEKLAPDWEASPVRFGGRVRTSHGDPVDNAAVRLIGSDADGRPTQVGPTIQTDSAGKYYFHFAPPGQYTLVVEVPGQAPQQQPLTLAVRERGEPLPELIHEVEVAMA